MRELPGVAGLKEITFRISRVVQNFRDKRSLGRFNDKNALEARIKDSRSLHPGGDSGSMIDVGKR